jgi:soluble lytic murein transglycosylase-like protein
MDIDAVPQEGNATLGGHRKVMYARASDGRMVLAASQGWEAEEIVTQHAVSLLQAQAQAARQRVAAGLASPLEFWMYERRMDLAQLAQSAGLWQWQARRHLRPEVFARLSPRELSRYADALGIDAQALIRMP